MRFIAAALPANNPEHPQSCASRHIFQVFPSEQASEAAIGQTVSPHDTDQIQYGRTGLLPECVRRREKEKALDLHQGLSIHWRRRWESNPRYRFKPICFLSREVPSTTRPRLHITFNNVDSPLLQRSSIITFQTCPVNQTMPFVTTYLLLVR